MSLVVSECAPNPPLRGVVLRAADYHERSAPLRRLESPFVGVVLIVNLGPEIEIDGQRTGSFVAGVWDRPTVTGHYGEQAGYQLNLDLLGARRLLGVPMRELTNQLVALEDVLGSFASELVERLADADDGAARHALAQRLLVGRLRGDHDVAPEVAHVFARLRATRGGVRVEDLAEEVGWSRRHLAARVHDELGLPPKRLARLIRVERAAARVRVGESLAEIAYGCGYSDQPHFNREFRELVGCSPSEFPFVQDTLAAT